MKYISARAVKNSDFESADFIKLNNCGAFIDTVRPIVTKRPEGRMDYQLIYISRGKMRIQFGKNENVYEQGTVILFRPGEPQIYRTDMAGTGFYWIHFTGEKVNEFLSFFDGNTCYVGAFPEFEEFCTETAKMYATANNASLYCVGKLISLIALLSDAIKSKETFEMLQPAVSDIHANFDKMRSNEEYAAMCGMSKSHFIREFHKTFGKPPQKYRTEIVVEEAKRLLLRGISVKDVADCFGFDDQFYFSRLFKKHTGVAPNEYKKTVR